MKYNKLFFEPISKDNFELILRVQKQIFPGESAKLNYIDTIEKNPERKQLADWLVSYSEKPIGVVGFYSYLEYPQTAWLSWFGVLPEERGKRYGSIMFNFWIDYAKRNGYTEARLYTSKNSNQDVIDFYEHKGMTQEPYLNESESIEITDDTLIFSLSLTDTPVQKWNNQFLGLTEQLEKQELDTE